MGQLHLNQKSVLFCIRNFFDASVIILNLFFHKVQDRKLVQYHRSMVCLKGLASFSNNHFILQVRFHRPALEIGASIAFFRPIDELGVGSQIDAVPYDQVSKISTKVKKIRPKTLLTFSRQCTIRTDVASFHKEVRVELIAAWIQV